VRSAATKLFSLAARFAPAFRLLALAGLLAGTATACKMM